MCSKGFYKQFQEDLLGSPNANIANSNAYIRPLDFCAAKLGRHVLVVGS